MMSKLFFILIVASIATLHGFKHDLSSYSSIVRRKLSMSSTSSITSSPTQVFTNLGRAVVNVLEKPVRLQYASAMAARCIYFLTQGIAVSSLRRSNKVYDNDETSKTNKSKALDPAIIVKAIVEAIISDDDDASQNALNEILSESASSDSLTEDEQVIFFRNNFESIIKLLKRDMNNIENGVYNFPYDLNPLVSSKQWNPLSVTRQLREYINDRSDVLDRQDKKDGLQMLNNFNSTKYPSYYLQNFHYQSDGWLSTKSAKIYDYQVESLFLGTADAMRRQIMPSISQFMKGRDASSTKVLDIATGTGRFISFVLDNYRDLDCTVMDLSPFYLAEAKKMLTKYEKVKYVEAECENLPFENESFDAITCVYLFHELPREIRYKAISEFSRVLKPGGKLFFVDSAQKGDVKNGNIFEGFTIIAHEPYYSDYVKHDLAELFSSGDLHIDESSVHWVTKTVTATKKSL